MEHPNRDEIRIGDRFQWLKCGVPAEVYEITNLKPMTGTVVVPDVGYELGEIGRYDFESSEYFVYLGNYSKSNRFKQIYNILNNER
jgi:hypothetical protein